MEKAGELGGGVLFCEWGPVRGIQLQPLPDVAAARSLIHKTGPAARREGRGLDRAAKQC